MRGGHVVRAPVHALVFFFLMMRRPPRSTLFTYTTLCRSRLAGTLGLGEAARFLGSVSETDKRRLLRRAWAAVRASPKEGWGISNVEAAACGTPALASDSPGLRESVRHAETGFLVPHGDARALADPMLALTADPPRVARLGSAARPFPEQPPREPAARATGAHL